MIAFCPHCREPLRKPKRKRIAQRLPGPSIAAKRKAKRVNRRDARMAMHDGVWQMNLILTADPTAPHGRCDCGCGYSFRHVNDGECDHWIERSQGGPDTPANGWRLAVNCHNAKGAGDREDWNFRRRQYCYRAAVPFIERRPSSPPRDARP